jgi:hypothetical protein
MRFHEHRGCADCKKPVGKRSTALTAGQTVRVTVFQRSNVRNIILIGLAGFLRRAFISHRVSTVGPATSARKWRSSRMSLDAIPRALGLISGQTAARILREGALGRAEARRSRALSHLAADSVLRQVTYHSLREDTNWRERS